MGAGQKFIFFIFAPGHGTPKKIRYSDSGGSLQGGQNPFLSPKTQRQKFFFPKKFTLKTHFQAIFGPFSIVALAKEHSNTKWNITFEPADTIQWGQNHFPGQSDLPLKSYSKNIERSLPPRVVHTVQAYTPQYRLTRDFSNFQYKYPCFLTFPIGNNLFLAGETLAKWFFGKKLGKFSKKIFPMHFQKFLLKFATLRFFTW